MQLPEAAASLFGAQEPETEKAAQGHVVHTLGSVGLFFTAQELFASPASC